MEKDVFEVGYFYLGGLVSWEYGYYTWTGPNYDAWTEEDGWHDNGQRASARTLADLKLEVDELMENYNG